MDLVKRVIRKSIPLLLILVGLSLVIKWERYSFPKLLGTTKYIPHSIIIGGLLGIANLKGLVWGLETLLGTQRANTKLVYLSLIRLGILFLIIITLTALRLINLMGLLTGMIAVFIVMVIEGLREAKR